MTFNLREIILLCHPAARLLSVCLSVAGADIVCGQTYPAKPVRIVTSEPGGSADSAIRQIVPALAGNLGQQVIVDNRPSGTIPGGIVSKALPDGYTVLLAGNTLWIGPLMQKTPYDPVTDFAPISTLCKQANVLVVNLFVPVTSVKELITLAKARPGEMNYGSTGTGSSGHLAGELFKALAGVNLVQVAYRGTAQAFNDLTGGQLQLMFPTAGSVMPHVKSGKLKALAVTSSRPSALFPGLPTVAASGLPDYESALLLAIFAPSKTPTALVNRLNQEIERVLNLADIKERFFNLNVDAVSSTPEQLADTVRSERARMGKVINDAGITRAN